MDRKVFSELLVTPLRSLHHRSTDNDPAPNEKQFDKLLIARSRPDVMPGSVIAMAGRSFSARQVAAGVRALREQRLALSMMWRRFGVRPISCAGHP